jgi:hypothetical protein
MLIVPSAAGFPLVFKSASTPSLMRLPPEATIRSARDARRPFMSAASWLVDIRSTIGATLKFISTGHAWPFMVNENKSLLIGR